jgi:FkbM family methyltransferase
VFLSYAQRLEDFYLAKAFAGQSAGFYVDIGAGHPVEDNVSYHFYLQGWSGLVVEPQADLLQAYRDKRPLDRRDHRLVGAATGETDFHIFPTLHGLSTTRADTAEAARIHEATFRTERREMITLAALLAEHQVTQIDFLKIDVEGAEHEVLAGGDWSRWRPAIILAESVSPGAEDNWRSWDALLIAQNYDFTLFDGLNRYYVARENPEVRARLPKEIAPWDSVVHHEW